MYRVTNETEWNEYGIYFDQWDYLADMFHVICAPFTVTLNLLVLFIAFRYVKLQDHLYQWFVVAMTTSDLIFGLTFISTKPFTDCFSRTFCSFYYVTTWTCQHMSIACLFLLNIDKFISLYKPLQYLTLATPNLIVREICAALCVSLILSFSTYFLNVHGQLGLYSGYWNMPLSQCILYIQPLYHNLKILICYIIPTVVSTAISCLIFYLAQQQSNNSVGVGLRHVSAGSNRSQQDSTVKRSTKRVFFVFSSTIWSALTTLPYRLLYSSYYLYQLTAKKDQPADEVTDETQFHIVCKLLLCLLAFGTVGNPIVTILTQHQYRKSFLKLICCQTGKSSRNRNSTGSLLSEKIPLSPCGSNNQPLLKS